MYIPGTNRLRHAARQIKRAVVGRGFILMYHRVDEASLDPWSLAVTPQHFAEHLEVLRRQARPMQLQQLVSKLHDGRVPNHAAVVTFDDGYVDNLRYARPLLEQQNVPATVFVASGHVGRERGFWWDELAEIVLRPDSLPASLHLTLGDEPHEWQLDRAVAYTQDERRNDANRAAWEGETGSRLAFYYSLWTALGSLPKARIEHALDELAAWAASERTALPVARAVSPDELRALGRGGLVEIGAHTVTHPMCTAHPEAVQRDEIFGSKACLEKMIEGPVTSFSYPFGAYTPQTITLVRQAGFHSACTTQHAAVTRNTDRFQLPRFEVRNWDGDEFARHLREWQHA